VKRASTTRCSPRWASSSVWPAVGPAPACPPRRPLPPPVQPWASSAACGSAATSLLNAFRTHSPRRPMDPLVRSRGRPALEPEPLGPHLLEIMAQITAKSLRMGAGSAARDALLTAGDLRRNYLLRDRAHRLPTASRSGCASATFALPVAATRATRTLLNRLVGWMPRALHHKPTSPASFSDRGPGHDRPMLDELNSAVAAYRRTEV